MMISRPLRDRRPSWHTTPRPPSFSILSTASRSPLASSYLSMGRFRAQIMSLPGLRCGALCHFEMNWSDCEPKTFSKSSIRASRGVVRGYSTLSGCMCPLTSACCLRKSAIASWSCLPCMLCASRAPQICRASRLVPAQASSCAARARVSLYRMASARSASIHASPVKSIPTGPTGARPSPLAASPACDKATCSSDPLGMP
mmetsp:Transcript_47738/g.103897  ORF Transcript_47738/g.103897 Transcript_47738/m.103897 type:complete len:201 (-) Transcript_47738:189-791(-)